MDNPGPSRIPSDDGTQGMGPRTQGGRQGAWRQRQREARMDRDASADSSTCFRQMTNMSDTLLAPPRRLPGDPIGRVPPQGVGGPRCFVDSRPGLRPAGTRRKGGPGVRRPERIPLNRKGLTLASPTLRRPPVYRRRRERKPRTVCSRDCNERRSGPRVIQAPRCTACLPIAVQSRRSD